MYSVKFPKSGITYLSTDNCLVYCEYVDKTGQTRLEQFGKTGEERYITLDLDELPGVKLKMVVKYKYGDKEIPVGHRECTFPYKPVLKKYSNGKYTFSGGYYPEDYLVSYYTLDENGNETGEFEDPRIYDRGSYYSYSDKNLYAYACSLTDVDINSSNSDYYHTWARLYSGERLGPYVSENSPTSPQLPTIVFTGAKKSAEPGKWDVKFTVTDWKNCDTIMYERGNSRYYFTEDTFSFVYDPSDLYKYAEKEFEFYGVSDSLLTWASKKVTIQLKNFTQEQLAELDVLPPDIKTPTCSINTDELTEDNWSEGFFNIEVTDIGAGVKEAYAYLGKKKYEAVDNVIKIPYTDILSGTGKLDLYAEDNAGHKIESQKSINTSETVYYTKYDEYIAFNYSDVKKIIYRLSSDDWKSYDSSTVSWRTSDKVEFGTSVPVSEQKITYSSNSRYQNSFIKCVYLFASVYGYSLKNNYSIVYTGTAGSGKYDVIFSGAKNAMAVASDAPVFIYTVATTQDYEVVKDWTPQQWETIINRPLGEYTYNFTSEDHSPRLYNIPVKDIRSGECYVVIAHFSDNKTLMSEVFVK